ncbi:hypothetical protein MUK42_36774 [Musa troglodytarum]|uniref:Uncharacterized protein n=1 Tax=Musa troglodytarum TaxID=320322 RepID=A0A9E7HTJ9_9LILI|nr:hypothetical protein MUK42_36774 [Musa troglodytarum]
MLLQPMWPCLCAAFAWKDSKMATDIDFFRRAVMPFTLTASINGWCARLRVRCAGLRWIRVRAAKI